MTALNGYGTYAALAALALVALIEGVIGIDVPGVQLQQDWLTVLLTTAGLGRLRAAVGR